jgi:hypothetical protein
VARSLSGLAYLAGFSRVRVVLLSFSPVGVAVVFGALLVSFTGYWAPTGEFSG